MLAAALAMTMAGAAPLALQVDAVESAAFDACARVLGNEVRVDDPMAMRKLGFSVEPADEEGIWAGKRVGDGHIRIGTAAGEPGCRVRFEGPHAIAIYEQVIARVQARGYRFAHGRRAPAEPRFVLDTLIGDHDPVAIVSMFRANDPRATIFALSLYPKPRD